MVCGGDCGKKWSKVLISFNTTSIIFVVFIVHLQYAVSFINNVMFDMYMFM